MVNLESKALGPTITPKTFIIDSFGRWLFVVFGQKHPPPKLSSLEVIACLIVIKTPKHSHVLPPCTCQLKPLTTLDSTQKEFLIKK